MKTFDPDLQAAYESGFIGKVATCFKITLLNGDVLGFTTWDRWLSYDGLDYNPDVGVGLTELDSFSIGTKVGTMRFTGLLGTYVSKNDLRFFWPGAKIFIFNLTPKYDSVDLTWAADLDRGIEVLRSGDLGNTKISDETKFDSEFRSISQRASLTFGKLLAPLCPYRFGVDDGTIMSVCPVDLDTKKHTVTLTTVSADGLTLTFTLATTDDFLTAGFVAALSGDNVGVPPKQIRDHSQSGTTATVVLYDQLPFPLVEGVTSLEITEGCQKRLDPDCIRHTGDGAPHGGFKDIAGPDFLALRVKP